MKKIEFATWESALQTYYPRFNLLPNAEAIELWYRELGEMPFDLLSAALRKWVNTERFPPSIAEMREICAEIVQGKPPDWGDAWKEVTKAIARHGMYQEEEALNSMSPLARQAASRIGWRDICMSENPEALRAQFRQVYEICQKREIEDRQLPPALKEAIAYIGGKSTPQITEGGNK